MAILLEIKKLNLKWVQQKVSHRNAAEIPTRTIKWTLNCRILEMAIDEYMVSTILFKYSQTKLQMKTVIVNSIRISVPTCAGYSSHSSWGEKKMLPEQTNT